MSKVTVVDVARELGMKVDEIASIEDSPAGLIVSFVAGNAPMVKVPDDQPDVEGKTGWMLLAVPPMKAGKVYQGTFPVYAQPVEAGAVEQTGDEYPVAGSVADVLAWVAGDGARAQEALDAEASAKKPRKSLVAELEAIIEQAGAVEQTGDEVEFERRGIAVPEGHTGVLVDDGTAEVLDADGNVVAAYDVDGNLIETA